MSGQSTSASRLRILGARSTGRGSYSAAGRCCRRSWEGGGRRCARRACRRPASPWAASTLLAPCRVARASESAARRTRRARWTLRARAQDARERRGGAEAENTEDRRRRSVGARWSMAAVLTRARRQRGVDWCRGWRSACLQHPPTASAARRSARTSRWGPAPRSSRSSASALPRQGAFERCATRPFAPGCPPDLHDHASFAVCGFPPRACRGGYDRG